MKRHLRIGLLALGALGVMGGGMAARASVIDLTDPTSFTAGSTSATGSVDGTAWTLTPAPGESVLTYTAFDATATPGAPLAFETDGVGITDDEVAWPLESLTMTFSEAVAVSGLFVLDLFGDESLSVYGDGDVLLGVFTATAPFGDAMGGYNFFSFAAEVMTQTLRFVPGAPNDGVGNPDFALAGVQIGSAPSPVPVPAAGLMLLGALGGLGLARRRRSF